MTELTNPLREYEAEFDHFIDSVPVAMARLDANGVTRHANSAAERLFRLSRSSIAGRRYDQPALEVRAADGGSLDYSSSPVPRALAGETVHNFELQVVLPGDDAPSQICVDASPLRAPAGDLLGAVVTARDLTAQHRAEQALKASQRRLNAVLNNTTMAVFVMDDRQHCVFANSAAEQLTGYTFAEMQGKPLHDVVHHTRPDGSHYPLEECPIDRAFPENAQTQGEEIFVHKDGSFYPVAFTASPIRDDASQTIGTVIEVRAIAEERRVKQQSDENRAFLQAVLDSTGEAFYSVDRTGVTTLVNRAFLEIMGFKSADEVIGQRLHNSIHHTRPDGSHYPAEQCPIYRAAAHGQFAHVDNELFYRADGSSLPVEYRAYPLMLGGEHRGAICTFFDISQRLSAERELAAKAEALEEQTRALGIVNRAAVALAGDLDLESVVQTVVDAGVELTEAAFGAFFYNVLDDRGARYTLYAISGVPKESFSAFPMPRATAIFQPTFEGKGIVRSDDITQDARYGHNSPHKGMPEGHLPVRSYLAVPVASRTGEVLGGLFFGHPEVGRFSALDEQRIVGLASQAAVAIDNARLFEAARSELDQRRLAEAALQKLNSELEKRVSEEVAQRMTAEEALRQAQKMEAIGQLTGGVAHDFNNLLTLIIGGLDTIKRCKPEETGRIERAIEIAQHGARRAVTLTSRLLAFSRRQPLEPKPLQLNAIVREMTELLHRTIGEQIELEGVLSPRLWQIEADQNQLESAILNLAVNARDAMPEGGKLTIETANTSLDESYAAVDAEVRPGQYVVLCVSDTGCGMSKETLSKAFEPFFTTKEVGRGTGLGLSMVYGFVKQSGGHVTIYSEQGHGTSVKLYFPRHFGGNEREEAKLNPTTPCAAAGETILLVEDNEEVRAYSLMILHELGYEVLEAADADVALEILKGDRRIDLLFTDVVLPGKSGRVLADMAAVVRPGLKVLFTTGYSRNAIVHQGRLDPGVKLLPKPFTFEDLATRLRDVLDEGNAAERAE